MQQIDSDHHFIRHILVDYTGDNSGKNVTDENGDKGVSHVEGLLSCGAIRPIYSVIFGDPAISPNEKISIATSVNSTFCENRVRAIPMEQTKKS